MRKYYVLTEHGWQVVTADSLSAATSMVLPLGLGHYRGFAFSEEFIDDRNRPV